MTTATDDLIKRIGMIDWTGSDTLTRSHIWLVKEYLRRSALWAQALDCLPEWPFFDVAEVIDPQLRPDPTMLAELDRQLEGKVVFWWGRKICEWAVHFAALPTVRQDLPHPYEPLLVAFERGCYFTTKSSSIDIDMHGGLPYGKWQERITETPLVNLDAATLDAIDNPPSHP